MKGLVQGHQIKKKFLFYFGTTLFTMKPPIFSCLSSSITNNGSIYGRFLVGPLPIDISLTLATILRRSLLHRKVPFVITSAEIQGAHHEYASLPGIQESVLEILLNLGEVVLTSKEGNLIGSNFKSSSQIRTVLSDNSLVAFLQISGPCVVTAKDINWPNGIVCVKPDAYIATLSANTILAMRIKIRCTLKSQKNSFDNFKSTNQIIFKGSSPTNNLTQSLKNNNSKVKTLDIGSKETFNESFAYNSTEGFGATYRSPLTDFFAESFLQSLSIIKKPKIQQYNPNINSLESTFLDTKKSMESDNILNLKNLKTGKNKDLEININEKLEESDQLANSSSTLDPTSGFSKDSNFVPNLYYYELQKRIAKFSLYPSKVEKIKTINIFQQNNQKIKNEKSEAFETFISRVPRTTGHNQSVSKGLWPAEDTVDQPPFGLALGAKPQAKDQGSKTEGQSLKAQPFAKTKNIPGFGLKGLKSKGESLGPTTTPLNPGPQGLDLRSAKGPTPFGSAPRGPLKVNNNQSSSQSLKPRNLEPISQKSWGIELEVSSSIYPVEKVNFLIERDDQLEGYRHRIIFEIWTNGSISPRAAVFDSIGSIIKLLYNFREPTRTFFSKT